MSSYKFKSAADGFTSELNLFHTPPLDSAIVSYEYQEYNNKAPLTANSIIEFDISAGSGDYISLEKSTIKTQVRILKQNGDPITNKDPVAMVNFSMHSLFAQVELSLQQTALSPSVGRNYPYKAIIDTLLSKDESAKETYLQAEGFFKDSAGFLAAINPLTGGNSGLLLRYNSTANGKVWEMQGPLHTDFGQQPRALISGVPVNIKLHQSSNAFRLMAHTDENYRVEIVDIVLILCRVKLNPGVIIGHANAIKEINAIYPYQQSAIKCFTISAGTYSFSETDLFQNLVPDKLCVALVSSKGYAGNYKDNPYNFKHYGCNFISFEVDGKSVPSRALQPDFANNKYSSCYLSLSKYDGIYQKNTGNFISNHDYKNGYTLFCFDLSGRHDEGYMSLSKKGETKLNIQFSRPVPESVTVIVYCKYLNVLQIDQSRNVIL